MIQFDYHFSNGLKPTSIGGPQDFDNSSCCTEDVVHNGERIRLLSLHEHFGCVHAMSQNVQRNSSGGASDKAACTDYIYY